MRRTPDPDGASCLRGRHGLLARLELESDANQPNAVPQRPRGAGDVQRTVSLTQQLLGHEHRSPIHPAILVTEPSDEPFDLAPRVEHLGSADRRAGREVPGTVLYVLQHRIERQSDVATTAPQRSIALSAHVADPERRRIKLA